MGKFEAEFCVDEIYQLAYEWDGYIFDSVLKYCAKCGIFPAAVNIGDVQAYLSKSIQERMHEDTKIGRDTFNRWRKDGSNGPRNSETILLLDTLLPNVRFLHRSFDVANKEILHQLYTLVWSFHYRLPLAVETDEFLYLYIEYVKKEYFHESIYRRKEEKEQYVGSKSDEAVHCSGEDLYACKLLDTFYKEYHSILHGITLFHAVNYNEETILTVDYKGKLYCIDWDIIKEEYMEILMKRQACIESFGNNLRTLFLGGDINA